MKYSWISSILFLLVHAAFFGNTRSQFVGLPANWSYTGSTGPSNWASIGFSGCNETTNLRQSPIDIVTANTGDGGQGTLGSLIKANSSAVFRPVAVSNNVEFECEIEGECGTLTIGTKVFPLIQFHFHSRSEHTINGNPTSFEVHLVHEILETKEFAVVGVLLNGAENGAVDLEIPIGAIDELSEGNTAPFTFDLNTVVSTSSGYFKYDGGLTTPNCTDPNNLGVQWIVQSTVRTMESEQVETFVDLIGPEGRGNWRPTLDLNGRQVTAVTP